MELLVTSFTVSCLSKQKSWLHHSESEKCWWIFSTFTRKCNRYCIRSTWSSNPWYPLTWQDWDKIVGPKSWRGRWWHTASCCPEIAAAFVGHHAPSCPSQRVALAALSAPCPASPSLHLPYRYCHQGIPADRERKGHYQKWFQSIYFYIRPDPTKLMCVSAFTNLYGCTR